MQVRTGTSAGATAGVCACGGDPGGTAGGAASDSSGAATPLVGTPTVPLAGQLLALQLGPHRLLAHSKVLLMAQLLAVRMGPHRLLAHPQVPLAGLLLALNGNRVAHTSKSSFWTHCFLNCFDSAASAAVLWLR